MNWVKEHLPELTFKNIYLEYNYEALTKEDNEVANLLRRFQEKDQEGKSEEEGSAEQEISYEQEPERREEEKKPKKIPPMFKREDQPLIISEVIDPNLNGHGIYALLKLGKWSILDFGAKYAVTPISKSYLMKKKDIL